MSRPCQLPCGATLQQGLLSLTAALFLHTAGATGHDMDLTELSLEDLMNIQVTSASKQSEPLSSTAAAIYVLTADDIRRSGARTLPEALRLVPGLHVAQIDSHQWAITARGLNSNIADKLEVRLDGRTLYTALFSGVYWAAEDIALDDIARIEVVRGPNAALWGANAVNGVISITSKKAAATLGTRLNHSYDTDGTTITGARFGHEFSTDTQLRISARSLKGSPGIIAEGPQAGDDAPDAWRSESVQGRLDFKPAAATEMTLHTGWMEGRTDDPQSSTGREDLKSWHVVGQISRQLSNGHTLSARAQLERKRRIIQGFFIEDRKQYELEIEQQLRFSPAHTLVWGLGYRSSADMIDASTIVFYAPAEYDNRSYHLFAQDQFRLNPRTNLTLGARLESSDLAGTVFQPTARLAYEISERQMLWAAASEASRSPNRTDKHIVVPVVTPEIRGSEQFDSETARTLELGYRLRPTQHLSLTLDGFHTRYDGLRGVDFSSDPALVKNVGEGRSQGFELSLLLAPESHWRLRAWYDYLDQHTEVKPGFVAPSFANSVNNDPRHRLGVRVSMDLGHNWEIDATVRHASELRHPGRKGYTEADLRIGWRLSPAVELGLVGRNLLNRRHAEFPGNPQVALERGFESKLSIRF